MNQINLLSPLWTKDKLLLERSKKVAESVNLEKEQKSNNFTNTHPLVPYLELLQITDSK